MSNDDKHVQISKKIKDFPPGLPKPHLARDWARSMETALTDLELTDVARKTLPPGKFDKLWSDAALEPPPDLPEGASFSEQLAWRRARDEVEKRRAHNELTMEKRRHWWTTKNHEYFVLITDSMLRTAPTLRETLRDRYEVSDGYYDGCAAFEFVELWLKDVARRHPQHDFYQQCLELIEKKRLSALSANLSWRPPKRQQRQSAEHLRPWWSTRDLTRASAAR